MKKNILLNGRISGLIAEMGHRDSLTIADAGLPVPVGTERIDLALTSGVPGYHETLRTMLTELYVEEAILALETGSCSPLIRENTIELLKKENPSIIINEISHEDFKIAVSKTRAVIRTGEFTPYANVILISGVTF